MRNRTTGGEFPATVDGPSDFYVAVTLGASTLTNGACRAILAEVAGRVNLTRRDGTVVANVPLVAGFNPLSATVINSPSSGTAATGVFALY